MPKVSQAHLDARREQIIEAAMICFAENGVHPTNMKRICEQARLSPGAVYRYFRSKEDIVAAVATSGREMIEDTVKAAKREGDPIKALDALIFHFFGLFDEDHPFYRQPGWHISPEAFRRMNIMLRAEALRNETVMEILGANYLNLQGLLTGLIQEAQQTGQICPDISPAGVAQALNGLYMGLENQKAYNPDLDVPAFMEVVRAIVAGLGSREAGSNSDEEVTTR